MAAKRSSCCVACLKKLNFLTEKFSDSLLSPIPLPLSKSSEINKRQSISPLVSISVVDADNLNVCMCNVMDDPMKDETASEKICPKCRNFIKKQPTERCTLVSKRTMLGHDVVISRIDTQFLSSTYSSSPSQLRKLQDPYTPESVESHSPQPEIDDFMLINEINDSDDILENMREINKHKVSIVDNHLNGELKENFVEDQNLYNISHIVSPSQLTTRLEILRRESNLLPDESGNGLSDNVDVKKPFKKSKCCLRCSCVIS